MNRSIPELDGIRGIAILAVLSVHVSISRIPGGFLGVDLFFVLSGFLITSLLIDEYRMTGRIHIGYFFARRALRILPPLFVGAILAALLWKKGDIHVAIPAMLFFYANVTPPHVLGVLAHTWSLSVEEHFYVLWPVVFLTFAPRGMRVVVAVVIGMILVAVALRVSLLFFGVDREFLYRFTATRIDSLATGCLGALWFASGIKKDKLESDLMVTATFCLLCATFLLAHWDNDLMLTAGYTVFAALCAVFIVLSLRADPRSGVRRLLASPVMRHIGRRSYGVYVYHYPVFLAMDPLRQHGDLLNLTFIAVLQVTATFLVAELSYRTVESAALAFKGRFYSARGAGAGSTAQR